MSEREIKKLERFLRRQNPYYTNVPPACDTRPCSDDLGIEHARKGLATIFKMHALPHLPHDILTEPDGVKVLYDAHKKLKLPAMIEDEFLGFKQTLSKFREITGMKNVLNCLNNFDAIMRFNTDPEKKVGFLQKLSECISRALSDPRNDFEHRSTIDEYIGCPLTIIKLYLFMDVPKANVQACLPRLRLEWVVSTLFQRGTVHPDSINKYLPLWISAMTDVDFERLDTVLTDEVYADLRSAYMSGTLEPSRLTNILDNVLALS